MCPRKFKSNNLLLKGDVVAMMKRALTSKPIKRSKATIWQRKAVEINIFKFIKLEISQTVHRPLNYKTKFPQTNSATNLSHSRREKYV